MAQGAPSSPPFTNTYTYDAFLSFLGEDTPIGFTGNLHSALVQRGILTFIDDEGLEKGEEITPSIIDAIKKSRIAIVILSKNYASSTFCLSELVHILECHANEKILVLPVFYDVDRSMGNYREALANHEERFKDDKDKVQKWRLALTQIADLSEAWHFKHGEENEHVLITKIIEEVSLMLNLLHVANYSDGLEARMRDIKSFKVSYDDLEENEKGIFLDIACFFEGCTIRYVTKMLNGRGFHQAQHGIETLSKKSLINIWRSVEYDDDIVTMHSLIQHMGKV